jgi:hypothetical protein
MVLKVYVGNVILVMAYLKERLSHVCTIQDRHIARVQRLSVLFKPVENLLGNAQTRCAWVMRRSQIAQIQVVQVEPPPTTSTLTFSF